MNKLWYFACFILFSTFFSTSRATHALGAEITYECVNNCTTRVHLSAYRDCLGATTLSTNITFTALLPNCTVLPPAIAPWSALVTTELVPLCGSFTTTCTNPYSLFPGVQEYYWFRDYDVCSASPCIYQLSWTACCRNSIVTSGNLNQAIFVGSATLNTTLATCNNSPQFSNPPPSFLCSGQQAVWNAGGFDPDGDSLAYSLGPCATNNNVTLPYSPGYSPSQPLGPSWNISINSINGDITILPVPGNIAFGVICIYIEEYRNGQLLNTVVRDYQLTVINCPGLLCGSNLLKGKVFLDANANCVQDPGEVSLPNQQLRLDSIGYYINSLNNGEYFINLDSGNYSITMNLPQNGLWSISCPSSGAYNISFPSTGDSSCGNDFGLTPSIFCPDMWVDVSIGGGIRPCFNRFVNVSYCNNGTDTAFAATIDLKLDTNLNYISSTGNHISSSGNIHTYGIGNVAPMQCGNFTILVYASCDTAMNGKTICVEAHIYPDSSCTPADTTWDKSSVNVTGSCLGDSLVCFFIENTGDANNGNMANPTDWRLYSNSIQVSSGTLQLCGQCDTTLCFPANGLTLRLEVDQRPGHPGNSHPNASIELCGSPSTSTGFVTSLPEDDADDFKSIQCIVASNSYDPNSKYVYPSGVTQSDHWIDSEDMLEYMIDFQNTGTANAIQVVLTDTLPQSLDLNTLTAGASSHSYTWQILPGRRLEFTFANIQLVPASVDSAASIGFVKFKIRQRPGNLYLHRIENRASIVFDFNPAIITNTVFSTIGWPVLTSVQVGAKEVEVLVYPNPASGQVFARMNGLPAGQSLQFELFDMMGRKVLSGKFDSQETHSFSVEGLRNGVYVYRILNENKMLKAGKLLVE